MASYSAKILDVLHAKENSHHHHHPATDCCLFSMNVVTFEVLCCLILASPKSCELVPPQPPAPGEVDVLLPLFMVLCNRSFQDGVLPPSQKRSILIPVLKGNGLNPADPTNYRPIANILFLSWIIEKIAASQLISHLERNNLLPSC